MKSTLYSLLIILAISSIVFGFTNSTVDQPDEEWISLFDGKTLEGWEVGGNSRTFTVTDGKIVVNGPRAHLYYSGPLEEHNFKNFDFKADVMTTRGSNSGIYFHTKYKESGWPAAGYEVQINNSHTDAKRTAGLYGVQDVFEAPADDGEWFTVYIKVDGKHIVTKVDGEILTDYTEPEDVDREGRVLSSGTFALQGHDPDSKVYFKNVMVRAL